MDDVASIIHQALDSGAASSTSVHGIIATFAGAGGGGSSTSRAAQGQGLSLAHSRAQPEYLREHIAHVRAQLEHLWDTSAN